MTNIPPIINQFRVPRGRLWARWGLDPVEGVLDGVYAEWEGGAFTRVEQSPQPPRDLPAEARFDERLLTPGLLNAHAHLDWSFRKRALPRGAGFAAWLRGMIAANRSLGEEDESSIIQAARDGLAEMIRSGVTEVWDICSPGWSRQALRESGVRAISFAEFLALRLASWPAAWEAWRERFERETPALEAETSSRIRTGVSPHAPYSICPPALAAAVTYATERGLPMAMHLAESPEEKELLQDGRGGLQELFKEAFGVDAGEEIGRGPTPIRRAAEAGALGPHTLAIHCNLPESGEIQLLQERGAVVVFCPRSHAFFGYPPYPLQAYRKAGVRLALGTDSLASNDSLDMRAEARALAALATDWPPLELLAVATGAALGEQPPYGGRGRLEAGKSAQWALWEIGADAGRPSAGELTARWLSPATRLACSSAIGLDECSA